MIIFSSCDTKKKGSHILDESKKISFIEKSKLKNSTYHTENLHYIQKMGTRLSPYIKNPIFINLMPSNTTQYQNIYETDIISSSAKSQIDSYNKNLKNHSFKKKSFTKEQEILSFIKKSNSTPIVLFGHSINGKTLVLPNGQKYSITAIHKECKSNKKTCLVLTCDGDDFNIEGKVTAFEALEMFNSAHHAFTNQEIRRVKDLEKIMIKKRDSLKNKYQIIVSFTVINISTGATYLVYDFVKEKK
jgi:hypothetical protein